MSDEFEGFDDLEAQLREAHAFPPREGLKGEIQASLRPARVVPWAGFSAAAAVLLAAAGVGLLLHQAQSGPIASMAPGAAYQKSAAGAGAADSGVARPLAFGILPALPMNGSAQTSPAAAPASNGLSAQPEAALVYRWAGAPITHCSPSPTPVLNGLRVLNGFCELKVSLTASSYRIQPPPVAGAELVYYATQAGSGGFFEPAYRLPDGSIVTALTPDETDNSAPP